MRPPTASRGITRRSLLQGSAATVLAGTVFTLHDTLAQDIELEPPPATPEVAPPPEPLPIGATVASKAVELGYDVERMFRFVADEVQYEPYAGALRGADGTLWSLAGNSVDKALLFAALLDEALVQYRIAFGELDASGIEALNQALAADAEALSDRYFKAQANGLRPNPEDPFAMSEATPEPVATDADREMQEQLAEASSEILNRAAELTDQHLSLIGQALETAGIELEVPEFAIPGIETSRHAWIQVADGPDWIDYAPALPGTASGVAPATAMETTAEIPADLVHMVTVRLVAEEYIGGTNVRRDTISVPLASADLVNDPISILVVPPQSVHNIGFTLNELLTGQAAYVPTVLANDIGSFADTPLMFGGGDGAGDILSAEPAEGVTLGEGEALGLWLAVDIASPGREPITVERPLYDRIGFERRQAAAIDFASIEPVTMVTDSEGQEYVAGLTPAHLLSVDSAHIPFTYAIRDQVRVESYGQLGIAGASLLALRDGLRIGIEVPQGSDSWISSPQLTLVTASKEDPANLESGIVLEFDLLHRAPTALPLADTNAAAAPQPALLAGIADQVAEQISVEMAAASVAEAGGDGVGFGANLGSIFAAAADQNVNVLALASPDDLTRISLEPEATVRVKGALDAGKLVIVPESSVDLDGALRSGWWVIDPGTGHTRDELDNGKGSAGFTLGGSSDIRYATFEEETFIIRLNMTAGQYYRKMLGFRIFCYTMWAATGLGIGFGLGVGPTSGAGLGGLGAGAAAAGAAAVGGC